MSIKITINGKKKDVLIKRTNKTISLSIRVYPDASIVVLAPYLLPKIFISKFINTKKKWIKNKINFWQSSNFYLSDKTNNDYLKDKKKALSLILERITYYNKYYNFYFKKISVRNQKTRWGSCSTRANLNFNFRLLYLPSKLRDYIIVHELCHLKELNHSKKFWFLVSETISDYKVLRKELKKIIIN